MTIVGADAEQLRATATKFTQAADRLQGSLKSLTSFVSNAGFWRGPDSERFRSEWNGQSVHSINAAVQALREGAEVLRRNADEQENASRPDGGGSGGGTAGGTSGTGTTAPEGTEGLYKTVRSLDTTYDGVMIQQVIGPDGKTRFIVYITGTDLEDSNRDPIRNARLLTGWADEAIQKKIDDALRAAGYNPNDKSKQPEMMFVGFSQGGMDAQNLIATDKYNAKALVTYGSPLVQGDQAGVSTAHLRAAGDNTPNLPAEMLAAARRDPISLALLRADVINGPGDRTALLDPLGGESKNIFDDKSSVMQDLSNPVEAVLTGNHGHESVYTSVGKHFDESNDPAFSSQKDVMRNFQGSVTRTWEGAPTGKS